MRELRNEIERMRLTHSDKLDYSLADLGGNIRSKSGAGRPASSPVAGAQPMAGSPGPAGQADQSSVSALLDERSTLRRRDRIREMFRRYRRLNGAELARTLGVSPKTICRDLGALAAEGLVRKVMPTASPRTHYFELRTPPAGSPS